MRENNFSSCVNVKKKSHLDLHHLYSSMNNTIELVGLWCLTALSTIFQLYRAVSSIGGGNHRPVTSH